ncbi:MAG: ParB/RepB/Spo0J family partition protein [Geminicoccaceae bacterium]
MKNARDTLRAVTGSLPELAAVGPSAARRDAVAAISLQIRGAADSIVGDEVEHTIAEGRAILDIAASLIDDTPWRDRQTLTTDDPDFRVLVDSIRRHGQIAPVALRQHAGRYEIIFGHRRVQACRLLEIPARAVVMERDDRALVVAMLIENQARKDLSAIEKAKAYQRILESGLLDRTTLAEVLGVSERQIANVLTLNRLPNAVVTALGDARSMALNVGMRLVAALQKSNQQPPDHLLAQAVGITSDCNARARYLIAQIDNASRAAAIDQSIAITDGNGRRYARLSPSGAQLVLRFQPGLDPEILRSLAHRIPALYEEIARTRGAATPIPDIALKD